MSATSEPRPMRIGEVAELIGTTPRTIRYYEEIGLLDGGEGRPQGKHRCYTADDVDRLQAIVRLRDLLGLSLDQLAELVAAETAQAEIRREYRVTDDPERQRILLEQAIGPIETQLQLVRSRITDLHGLERELVERRARVTGKLESFA